MRKYSNDIPKLAKEKMYYEELKLFSEERNELWSCGYLKFLYKIRVFVIQTFAKGKKFQGGWVTI